MAWLQLRRAGTEPWMWGCCGRPPGLEPGPEPEPGPGPEPEPEPEPEPLEEGSLAVLCVTWNLNGKIPTEDLKPLLLSPDGSPIDIYVIGTQESGGTIGRGLLPGRGALGAWESLLAAALGPGYTMVAAHALAATHLAIFVSDGVLPFVRHARSAHVATGVGNVLGNKGGVGIALSLGPSDQTAWQMETLSLFAKGGWATPGPEEDSGPSLIGRSVWVRGWGEGTIQEFKKSKVGPSSHVVKFPDLRRVETIKLARKSNGQTPWLVQDASVPPRSPSEADLAAIGSGAAAADWRPVSLLFVSAHLAAHQDKVMQRNDSFHMIDRGLPLHPGASNAPPLPGAAATPRARSSDRFDASVWLGDLNYRIDGNRRVVEGLLAKADRAQALAALRGNDQLNAARAQGLAFAGWAEGPLHFPPTYKFDPGTDDYDTGPKCRVPAWTDRVLYKSGSDDVRRSQTKTLQLLSYESVPTLRVSDHRPVRAVFGLRLPDGAWGSRSSLADAAADGAAGVAPGADAAAEPEIQPVLRDATNTQVCAIS